MTIQPGPGYDLSDPHLAALAGERRRLINLAYRLLGSLSEAEDVVQETYVRWYAMPRQRQEAVESVGAWLTTVATRICLNLLGSARARRERYVGHWIPEPLPGPIESDGSPGGPAGDPADRVTLDESVTMAFLVLLESMTPAERVAFVLHDVFRYSFTEVAGIVGRSPAACRQSASSARRRLRDGRPPARPVPAGRAAGVVRDFKQAWAAKDVGALIGLLDPAATAVGDGGGRVSAVPYPIEGGEQVAHFLVRIAAKATGLTFDERTVNGRPGLVARHAGATVAVYAFHVAGDRSTHIWGVLNPEKLRPWTT
ncbi:RNA polymerase sigma factor SigJ [Streptomyces sp. NPDC051310]|uniref:RNA polymerase sigma factor SigJ n=1 Tax=Streptomyces sp. NPDC051310 TaxID=3365649 RepID=UPI0037A2AA45